MVKRFFLTVLAGALISAGMAAPSGADVLKNIKFLSGPTGTTWYSQAAAFAGIASKDLGMTVDVMTGSAISNVILIEQGKALLGLTFSSYLPAMAKGEVVAKIGKKDYFDKPMEKCCTLMNATTAGYVFLVEADSPFQTIGDLKAKNIKIATYPAGFTARFMTDRMLEAHGSSLDVIEKSGGKVYIVRKYSEACDLLAKGQVDVIAYTMAVNTQSAALSELESQKAFKILKLDQKGKDVLMDELPLLLRTVPKGLQKSITEDVEVLADTTIWLISRDVSDETVRAMLDSILKNMETMAQVGNSEFQGFTVKDMIRIYGKGKQIPLHPAAKKFYEEKGAI